MATSDAEIRLRCMELAIDQARREGAINFLEAVANLQTWFYSHIIVSPPEAPEVNPEAPPQETAPETKADKRKGKADKAPDIFR